MPFNLTAIYFAKKSSANPVMSWIVLPFPPKPYIEVSTPSTSECDLTGRQIFTELMSLKWGYYAGSLIQYD